MLALELSLTEPSLSLGDYLDFLIAYLPVLGISSEDGIYKHNSYMECKKISLLMFLFYNQFNFFNLFNMYMCACMFGGLCGGVAHAFHYGHMEMQGPLSGVGSFLP